MTVFVRPAGLQIGSTERVRVALMLAPVEFGGAERVCLNLLRNIDRDQYDIYPILLIRPWEPGNVFARAVRDEGFAYSEIPVALRSKFDPLRIARCFRLTHDILKRNRFDVLHTHGYFSDIVGISAARIVGLPCISTCHGFITNTWKYRLYNRLDHIALRGASRVIAVSDQLRDHLVARGIEAERLLVLENAVPAIESRQCDPEERIQRRQRLGIREDEFVLGYVGRLSQEKGVRDLLVACSRLEARNMQFRTLIVGTGPQRDELESVVKRLNLSQRVSFLGFQENPSELLGLMEAFVLPSLTEGTPMALLEAMARHIPVIATAVGGVPGVIKNGRNGILISPGSPEAIVDAVVALRLDAPTRQRLAERAAHTVEVRYGMKNWVAKMQQEYARLAKRHPQVAR